MLVAERKASIVEQVQLVEDEQVLRMIEALLRVHLDPLGDCDDSSTTTVDASGRPFNPRNHYTAQEISAFEAREDFIGYAADKSPLFSREEGEKMDQAVDDIIAGSVKGISHEELKVKLDKKMEAWRQRTK